MIISKCLCLPKIQGRLAHLPKPGDTHRGRIISVTSMKCPYRLSIARCHDRRWSEASKMGACRLKHLEVVCRSIDPFEPAISYEFGPKLLTR
jgi:hypothetical protein